MMFELVYLCMVGVSKMYDGRRIVPYLRLWSGNTIGKCWSVAVILQINGDKVNINSLDDMGACIDSYLCKKE